MWVPRSALSKRRTGGSRGIADDPGGTGGGAGEIETMKRRKFVIGMGALAAGSAAAVGTGAFTAAEISGRDATIGVVDDTNGLIGLKAGDSDLVRDDGGDGGNELVIDFDPDDEGLGVNPNSVYQVGGLGGIGNLEEVPGDPPAAPDAKEVAIDTETDITEGENYAFKLTNQTTSSHPVEITYKANEDEFPGDTRVYMISYNEDRSEDEDRTSALTATATPDNREASILYDDDAQWSENVGAGEDVRVSIIVEVNGVEDPADLGGELIVRAGSHDEFRTDPSE